MSMRVVSTRLESKYVEALRRAAAARETTVAELLRTFAVHVDSFLDFVDRERLRQKSQQLQLDGNLAEWVLSRTPADTPSNVLEFLGDVLKHAAIMRKAEQSTVKGGDKPGA